MSLYSVCVTFSQSLLSIYSSAAINSGIYRPTVMIISKSYVYTIVLLSTALAGDVMRSVVYVRLSVSTFLNQLTFDLDFCVCLWVTLSVPSVLWRCWLGGRKGIRPVKTEWWGAGVVICLERGADLHMAQLMPLPLTVSCFSKTQIGISFLVPAHPGSLGKKDR